MLFSMFAFQFTAFLISLVSTLQMFDSLFSHQCMHARTVHSRSYNEFTSIHTKHTRSHDEFTFANNHKRHWSWSASMTRVRVKTRRPLHQGQSHADVHAHSHERVQECGHMHIHMNMYIHNACTYVYIHILRWRRDGGKTGYTVLVVGTDADGGGTCAGPLGRSAVQRAVRDRMQSAWVLPASMRSPSRGRVRAVPGQLLLGPHGTVPVSPVGTVSGVLPRRALRTLARR